MEGLRKTRGQLRTKVTKMCDKITNSFDGLSGDEKLMFTKKLTDLRTELNIANKAVCSHGSFMESDLDECIDEEERYDEKLGILLIKLVKSPPNNDNDNTDNDATHSIRCADTRHRAKVPLPQITLPLFSNKKDENFRNFIRSFEAILEKHRLTDYEKFVYLKNKLSGGPLALVNSLDVSKQQYDVAKNLLEEAFDCMLNAKHDTLKCLSELKLKTGSDPYVFIGELKAIMSNFESLEIVTQDVLQFFVWNSLDDGFQSHITAITNKSQPTLPDIEKNLFEACSRYIKETEKVTCSKPVYKKTDEFYSTAMAVNVHPNFKKPGKFIDCALCMQDKKPHDHLIRTCPVYNTPKAKVDKLNSIKGCIKCSFVNHKSSDCKFKFLSTCRHCNKNHMSYLCLRNTDGSNQRYPTNANPNNRNVCSGNVATLETISTDATCAETEKVSVSFSTGGNSIMLPTFTADVHGPLRKSQVRVFKDGGCQRTFIKRSLADKLDLPILENNVKITIDGFNSANTIDTQIVELPLLIGSKRSKVRAIIIDNIRTKFYVKNIDKVVHQFICNGYKIADKWLLNNSNEMVTDIDIIIGTDDDDILPMTSRLFGSGDKPSSFLETEIGVVFSGNVDRMLDNLEYLPSNITCKPIATSINSNISFLPNNSSLNNDENSSSFSSSEECTLDKQFFLDELVDLDLKVSETLDIAVDSDEKESESNIKLVDYVLQTTSRNSDGKLVMPVAWNSKNAHLLSKNFHLSKQILNSTLKKLEKEPKKLEMYDAVFKKQLQKGIEKIPNITEFMKLHPECSFLSHMAVFRMEHDSTKCRIVFLPNLCERNNGKGLSHNQVILPGPCLNQKMSTAVTLLRFDKYLMTFDLKKAFSMIELNEMDQNRLLFLWYNNIDKGDYSLVGYKSLRVPFGLRSSPLVLLLALYKILILDQTEDIYLNNLKKNVYNNIYMDNGSYTTNEIEDLYNSYVNLPKIFGPYKFDLQQFYTNVSELQSIIDGQDENAPENIKLFGLLWNRSDDSISPSKINLNGSATTKRKVLGSLNEVYDIFNVYAPVLLRAKLFLQKLQLDPKLGWDDVLPENLQREWGNIVKQANSTPIIPINRSVGKRNSDFSLIGFSDASSNAYGCVIYIKDNVTNEVSFLTAKSKLLSSEMQKKTMPSLELQGIEFVVETMIQTYNALTGETVVIPIKISSLHVYTDSSACLHWLQAYSIKFDKSQKHTVFVNNRLEHIEQLCQTKEISFRHISGDSNPSDHVTRPCSYNLIKKTDFYCGPKFIREPISDECEEFVVNIPNHILRNEDEVPVQAQAACASPPDPNTPAPTHLIPVNRYSNFFFMVRVYRNVLKFCNALKRKVLQKGDSDQTVENLYSKSYYDIIKTEQQVYYGEIFDYLNSKQRVKKVIPELVSRLNLFIDELGILRVKSKLPKNYNFRPILMPKDSQLTAIIIRNIHENLFHSGIYAVLKELRKNFWILHYFSVVRKVLKTCVSCRRVNEPAIKINQNSYRDFRINPDKKPFSNIFLDYAGPFTVSLQGTHTKVWLLIITCLFTRGINLKICRSANVDDFLRALQMHIFEHGIFSVCISDLGSQIQSGANLITAFLNDSETRNYFECNGMETTKFQHFPKGNSALGSIVEVCVKMTKQLIFKSIHKILLDYFEFEFIVCKVVDLVNKRPIAFRESLRSLPEDSLPFCITPEVLIRGYETCTINIIPQIQSYDEDEDYDPTSFDGINQSYEKLCKVKSTLIDLYHSEFVATLVHQAIDKKDRYKPVHHKVIKPGDIVLLVEKHQKRYNYPMAKVQRVETNSLDEVTAAYVYKGATKELV